MPHFLRDSAYQFSFFKYIIAMNDFFKDKGGKAGAVKKEKKPANEMEEETPVKVEKKGASDPN
jgi:hypothetical protein